MAAKPLPMPNHNPTTPDLDSENIISWIMAIKCEADKLQITH